MKILRSFLVIILLPVFAFGQNYKQVKIYLNDPVKDLQELANIDVDVEHAVPTKDGAVIVFVGEESMAQLSIMPYRSEILIDDWNAHYQSLPKMSPSEVAAAKSGSKNIFGVEGFGFGSMSGHYTLAECYAQLDSLKLLYPNLITIKAAIGYSTQDRPLYMVKISDNPNVDEDEPEVLYTGLHHAREPMGMMNLIYYMYYLLENYNTKPEVKYVVDNRELYFVPVVNPDGYEYNRSTSPSGGGMWRKNRKNNGDGTYGVDLNRNYGPMNYWNAPNGGSSTSSSSDTYRGTAPFSEPETQAIKDFIASRKIKNALNYHTFSNLLIYPYGALSRETPDSLLFREYANEMTRYNNYTVGTDMQTVGYSTRGNSDDFMYDGDTTSRSKILAMTPEVGNDNDYFWAPQNRIFPLAQENLFPNLYYAWAAGGFVRLHNLTFDRQYFNPGDNVQMNVQLKNKGLSTAKNVSVVVTSNSPYITMGTNSATTDSIVKRNVYTLPTPLSFTVNPNTPADQKIKLVVESKLEGVTSSVDTFTIITGTPVFYFADTTNNPTAMWTIAFTPTSSPKWETFESSFHSAPNSYHDSKTGVYAANAIVSLTSTNFINLQGSSNPTLSFWTKYDIENSWDCGQVFASTNGSTWTALSGLLTEAGSGQGKQIPAGTPVYDNVRSEWAREEMSLSAFGNQQIKLKFELRTDGSLQKDGWWIDDIGIVVYQIVPVELSSFTASVSEKSVLLKWETATELNNRGFEVQRSTSPGRWDNIGYVRGQGTATSKSSYTFTDENPTAGSIRYRLKQIDFDGTYRILPVAEVNFAGVTEYSLMQNYPNPFNPETVINYSLKESGNVSIKVFNILGKQVATLLNETKEAGKHSVRVDAAALGLSSGTYFYELKSAGYRELKKMSYVK